jgi:hypothetical protein
MRWVVASVLAMATAVHAAPWLGFAQLAAAPTNGVQLRARIASKRSVMRGRIVACHGDGPCPFAGARLSLDVGGYDPTALEQVDRLTGTVTLADGTACTFAGDVWGVRERERRIPRGALHGQATCPGIGRATLSMWVKGYRPPLGGA